MEDNWKPSNPKDILGVKKVPMTPLSFPTLMEMGVGMLEGACKYGRHNFRDEGVAASTYIDAAFRHMAAYWEGEDIDTDSGIHHITKALTTLMVLRDAQIQGLCTDDRPIKTKVTGWMQDLNRKVEALLNKYPNPKPPYTEIPLKRKCRASVEPSENHTPPSKNLVQQ